MHQDFSDDKINLIGTEKITELFKFKIKLQEKCDAERESAENRIFLSHDTERLMIIQQGYAAEFFERVWVDKDQKKVRWELFFRQD